SSQVASTKKSPLRFTLSGLFLNNPGGFLLSHTVARAVPSAPRGLTSVFGMGTGVALSTQPPENFLKKRAPSALCFEKTKYKVRSTKHQVQILSVAETWASAC